MCLFGYHFTFGSNCGASAWRSSSGCACQRLCGCVLNLCATTGTNLTASSRYSFAGLNNSKKCCSISAENLTSGLGSSSPIGFDNNESSIVYEVPIGMGGQSGNSSDNGKCGGSEQTVILSTYNTNKSTSGGTSCSRTCLEYSHFSNGYDFTFGGTQYSCFCANYCPGRYSACSSFCGTGFGGSPSPTLCYECIGTTWTYVFGTNFSGTAHCWCMPVGLAHNATTTETDCRNKFLNVGFSSVTSIQPPNYVIPLSSLVSSNNTNISDIVYGAGAFSTQPAKFGGGGNRLNPSGGQGLVVVIY